MRYPTDAPLPGAGSVLVLGAASWNRMVYVDHLPQGLSATLFGAHEIEALGSTGAGKSAALAALGCQPTFHCALGRDERADKVIAACDARGINLIVDRQDAETPHHLNIMDQLGGRYSIFLSNGTDQPVIDEARLADAVAQAETIFLSLAPSSKQILHLLQSTNAEILLDLHDYDGMNPWYDDFIACADVIQFSDVSLADPIAVARRLLQGRAHQIVVTKAEKGAVIVTSNSELSVPPCSARMVDSNGAGDAFSVALWFAQSQGLATTDAGAFAAAAAALAVEDPTLFPENATITQIAARAHLLP